MASCVSAEREVLYRDLQSKLTELTRKVEAVNLKVKDLEDSLFLLDDRLRAVERTQAELKDDISRLSKRVAVLTRQKKNPSQPPRNTSSLPPVEQTPENLYRRAYDLLMSRKYDEAEELFLEFINKYPSHSLADNAVYWLGECYYAKKDYANALNYFLMVIEDYPQGNKVPDAMLKLGYTYEKLGLREKSLYDLKKLIADFPFSEPAEKAKIKINELEKKGDQP